MLIPELASAVSGLLTGLAPAGDIPGEYGAANGQRIPASATTRQTSTSVSRV